MTYDKKDNDKFFTGIENGKGSAMPMLPEKESGGGSSTTHSAVSPGTVIITDEASQLAHTGQTAEQAVASLNRDTATAHPGPLAPNPDLQAILDRQAELADAAARAGTAVAKTVGDISQAMYIQINGDPNWGEGGIYKAILQAAGAALVAELGNGEGLNAALGALANQLTSKELGEFSRELAMQLTDDPEARALLTNFIQNMLATGIGFAAGGETGGNAASNMDRNNRQLHPYYEIPWIEKNARKFAIEKLGINEEDLTQADIDRAISILTTYGLITVDYLASMTLSLDPEVAKLAGDFINEARENGTLPKFDWHNATFDYFTNPRSLPNGVDPYFDPFYFYHFYDYQRQGAAPGPQDIAGALGNKDAYDFIEKYTGYGPASRELLPSVIHDIAPYAFYFGSRDYFYMDGLDKAAQTIADGMYAVTPGAIGYTQYMQYLARYSTTVIEQKAAAIGEERAAQVERVAMAKNSSSTNSGSQYSGNLIKVNNPDPNASKLADRIGGEFQVKFANDPNGREFDVINDKYIAQTKPALKTVNATVRNQMKATFEAAQASGKEVYYHFDGAPDPSVIGKLYEYSNRYGINVTIDTKPFSN